MAYVGNPIDTQNTFQSLVGKRFNGDGSTTAFTLDVAPSSTLDIEVFVGNVRQDPNSAYTLSGTTLTFTGAPPSGTNNIYVVHQAKSVGTIDVPASGVQAGSLASSVLTGQTDIGGAIADADLFLVDDGAGGTLRKTAASRIKTYVGGFDVTSITGATELAAQPAATDEIVLSDAGTLKRLDIKHISNTPAFSVKQSGAQTINHNTDTKLEWATEVFDSDGTFASHKFTPVVPGKYFLKASVLMYYANAQSEYMDVAIYKNGTKEIAERHVAGGNIEIASVVSCSGIVTADSDDYFEAYVYHNYGQSRTTDSNDDYTRFEGFRLTGMES